MYSELRETNKTELFKKIINPLSTTPQSGKTHSNNLSAAADELFEYV